MSQQWFQNLMNEFFRSLGLNELPPALPVHVLSVDDTMELLLGHEPSGWLSLVAALGGVPEQADAEWYERLLVENSIMGETAPQPTLAVQAGQVLMRAQLPLEYLTADTLKAWVENFLDQAQIYKSRFVTLSADAVEAADTATDSASTMAAMQSLRV